MAATSSQPPAMAANVTPVQVAFIVDRYLSDHRFTKTLSVFRSEASNLLSSTKGKEAPKNLLSLAAILEEYISLKEQRVIVDQEKCRVEALAQSIQDALRVYNSAVPTIPRPPSGASSSPPFQLTPVGKSEPRKMGSPSPAIDHHSSNSLTNPKPAFPSPKPLRPAIISASGIELPSKNKRKVSKASSDPTPPKKRNSGRSAQGLSHVRGTKGTSQSNVPRAQLPVLNSDAAETSSCQRSSLVNKLSKSSPQSDSSGPHTPPQSLPPQNEKTVSPSENSSLLPDTIKVNSSYVATPIDCQIVSTQTVVVSPFKHTTHYATDVTYRISPLGKPSDPKRIIKRDHVKGRLDFNDTNESTMTSKKPISSEATNSVNANGGEDLFDFPNFDVFGSDFSLSDLLLDIDLDGEGVCPPALENVGPSASPGVFLETEDVENNLSTVTTLLTEKNFNLQGPELVASKSISKSITILSPMKNQTSAATGQDN